MKKSKEEAQRIREIQANAFFHEVAAQVLPERARRKTFQILVNDGDGWTKEEVKGYVVGPFGIRDNGSRLPEWTTWSITHLQSGRKLPGSYKTRAEAVTMVVCLTREAFHRGLDLWDDYTEAQREQLGKDYWKFEKQHQALAPLREGKVDGI